MLYHIGAGEPVLLDIQGRRRFVGFVSVCLSVIFAAYAAVNATVSVFSYVTAA